MGKHRESARVASYVTAGVALELAGMLGFVYAVDTNAPMARLLAATTIFVDGTRDIIPTGNPQVPDRMRGALAGTLDQGHDYVSAPDVGGNYYVDYPRAFGVLTGLADPTYDASRGIATEQMIAAIKDAREQNPDDPIYVVGFSQGANAQADALKQLRDEGYDTDNITFVMLGNGARNDGGLWARLPAGVYVPLIGLSCGASTNPDPNGPNVIQISKQYDGASDVPRYVLNPVAWANTALGFLYVHNGYYADVDFDLNNDNVIDQTDVDLAEADPEHYIVTRNGNISNVVIRNEVGDLPLTRPLLDLGVPPEVVKALDPLLRAIIETAYDRQPNGGTYPAEPELAELAPSPSRWEPDADAVAAGLKETVHRLAELGTVNVHPISPATSNQDTGEQPEIAARYQESVEDPVVPQGTVDEVNSGGIPDAGAASSVDVSEPDPSAGDVSEAAQSGSVAQENTGAGDPTTAPKKPRTNVIRGPIGGSPGLSGLKTVTAKINGAVTDTMNKVKDALTGKRPGSGSGSGVGSTPGPDTTGTDAGPAAGGGDGDSDSGTGSGSSTGN